MLKDSSGLNPKGHVKLELYNDNGVFLTKEKKNLVVQSANEIVANMMADPAKVLRVSQVDKGDSALSANSNLLYPFALSVQAEVKSKFESNWGATNTVTEFEIEELKGLTSLDAITVGAVALVLDVDVFLVDSEKGKVKFATAPLDNVVINFHKVKNPYMKMIAGTEVVKVNGVTWKRAAVADHATRKYQVNARTGELLFAASVIKVEVAYDYNMNYSLGFMALGGKPNAESQAYQPVTFGNSNKLDINMKNEFAGSRVAVQYPSSISYGAKELEPAIPTQPVATILKEGVQIIITDDGTGSAKLVYDLPHLHDTGTGLQPRTLQELVTIKNDTTTADIKSNTTVASNKHESVTIKFAASDVAVGETVTLSYRLKLHDFHLVYQLPQSPVIELVSIKHTDAGTGEVKEYTLLDRGLNPNQGDVWISNPSTGHITFSKNPTGGPKVETPGTLTIEYRVNAGTTVQFIADFKKGVPAPSLERREEPKVIVLGQSTIALDYQIAKDVNGKFLVESIIIDGASQAEGTYAIAADGRSITPNSISENQSVTVTYRYEKASYDVYQVAMFDDKIGGKMFNISGIGPVTKDKNTGMRISWSVTF